MNLNTLVKVIFGILLLGLCWWGYGFYTNKDNISSSPISEATDLGASCNADKEIAEALAKLKNPELKPVPYYTQAKDGQKQIALTFDGLPRKSTADRLLDLLEKEQVKAMFFVEGANALRSKETIAAIEKKGQRVGNYTFIGLAALENAPQEVVVSELCKTQKALQLTANLGSDMFKAPRTRYTYKLLTAAAACGLKNAVHTNVYVNLDSLKSDAAAEAFVASLPAGSIVSFVTNHPVEVPAKKDAKAEPVPAFDKQPSVTLTKKAAVKQEDIVAAAARLIAAAKKQELQIVSVEAMPKQMPEQNSK